MFTLEGFHTVPVVAQFNMTPFMEITNSKNGFPLIEEHSSPTRIDLSLALIKNPTTTYFVRVTDDGLAESGLSKNDIAIVDREMEPRNGDKILSYFEGEFIWRILTYSPEGFMQLQIEPTDTPLIIEPDVVFSVWGVVRDLVKSKDYVVTMV